MSKQRLLPHKVFQVPNDELYSDGFLVASFLLLGDAVEYLNRQSLEFYTYKISSPKK